MTQPPKNAKNTFPETALPQKQTIPVTILRWNELPPHSLPTSQKSLGWEGGGLEGEGKGFLQKGLPFPLQSFTSPIPPKPASPVRG